jgi:FixJ family two-component response regulator
MILSGDPGQDEMAGSGADGVVCNPTRVGGVYVIVSPEDLQIMIDLYRSGVTARQVAEQFGISQSSVKRVLRAHSVCRERPRSICTVRGWAAKTRSLN